MHRRTGQLEVSPDCRPLVEKYRALCRKYRALVDRCGADVAEDPSTFALAFAAIRRSRTGIALLCSRAFLIRNARWLAVERWEGDDWRCGGRAYPNLRALAITEASQMSRVEERARGLRFSRPDLSQVIEVRLERLDRPGRAIYLAMVRDVTEEARAERRAEEARSHAAEQERSRAVGDLASSTAHAMNNVLHAMAMRLASLRAEPDGADREEGLRALGQLVADAAACVSRLQDLAGCSRSPAERDAPCSAGARAAPEAPSLRVLVVDDDPDVLEAAGLALSHLGQEVDGTPSGADAVARFRAGERFDLVLCDIGMPQVDGWEVAREVHALSPGTQLYLVSGWAREIRPDDVRRAGAAGLLAKPLSLETLRALLASVHAGSDDGGAGAAARSTSARPEVSPAHRS